MVRMHVICLTLALGHFRPLRDSLRPLEMVSLAAPGGVVARGHSGCGRCVLGSPLATSGAVDVMGVGIVAGPSVGSRSIHLEACLWPSSAVAPSFSVRLSSALSSSFRWSVRVSVARGRVVSSTALALASAPSRLGGRGVSVDFRGGCPSAAPVMPRKGSDRLASPPASLPVPQV